MAKVFRRPMFRGGSTNMNGIMSGIQDRQNYAEGDAAKAYREFIQESPQTGIDPVAKLLISGGLRGLSETRGGSALANTALAFQEPTERLFSDLENRDTSKRSSMEKALAFDLENERSTEDRLQALADMKSKQAHDEKLAMIKRKTDLAFQKDFTPDRKYYELMKERTNSAAEIKYGQKANIDQKFPRGTARFDAYYSSDLAQSNNPIANEIKSNFESFVPYDSKKGRLVYEDMMPGMYYFDPKKNVYITNVPPSEDEEGGYYIVNPETYEKRKLNP